MLNDPRDKKRRQKIFALVKRMIEDINRRYIKLSKSNY